MKKSSNIGLYFALVCAGLPLLWHKNAGAFPGVQTDPNGAQIETSSPPSSGVGATSAISTHDPSFAAGLGSSAAIIFDASARITDRIAAVGRLAPDLNRDQISELYAFLKALPGPQEKNLAGLNVLKNNLVSLLQDQIHPAAGLTSTLIEIYCDAAQDAVARDYALQHLVTWYEQGAADAPDAKSKIQAVLWKAVRGDTSIAGTALLGLHRLNSSDSCPPLSSLSPPFEDRDGERRPLARGAALFSIEGEICEVALRMLMSANVASAARISAIQVCAEREVAEALPAIQTLAQTDASTALRISAIAALGRMGGPQHLAVLQQIEAEQNKPLEPSIEGALRRLQARLLRNPAITQNSL